MRTATLKVISDGSLDGTRVVVVDDEGQEHQIGGVMSVQTDIGRDRVPTATVAFSCLAAWPKHKAKLPIVDTNWDMRLP